MLEAVVLLPTRGEFS